MAGGGECVYSYTLLHSSPYRPCFFTHAVFDLSKKQLSVHWTATEIGACVSIPLLAPISIALINPPLPLPISPPKADAAYHGDKELSFAHLEALHFYSNLSELDGRSLLVAAARPPPRKGRTAAEEDRRQRVVLAMFVDEEARVANDRDPKGAQEQQTNGQVRGAGRLKGRERGREGTSRAAID